MTEAKVETDPLSHRKRSIRSGVAWKLAAGVTNDLMRIGIVFALARLLSPAEYGLASMALVISGFALLFSDLALGAGLVQLRTITERDRSTMFWMSVGAGALLTVAGVAASGLIAALFNQPSAQALMAAMSLAFIVTSLGATQAALLTRSMDFRALELRVIAGTAVGGLVGITVAARGGGAWAIVTQQLALAAISTLLLWFVTPWRPRALVSRASIERLARFSAYLMGNRIVFLAERTIVPVMIGRFLGTASLGLFTLGYNLAFMPITRITQPMQEVMFPALSREQDQKHRLAELWLKSLALGCAVALPALAGLAVVAPDFVSVLLGEKWSDAAAVIQVLAWAAIMSAAYGSCTSLVLAVGRADALFVVSLLSLATTTVALAIGIQWGLDGATIALACGATIVSIGWTTYVSHQAGLAFAHVRHKLSGILVSTAVMAFSTAVVREALVAIGIAAIGRLVICVVVGIVVYTAVLRWRDPDVFSTLLGSIPRPRLGARLASRSPQPDQ